MRLLKLLPLALLAWVMTLTGCSKPVPPTLETKETVTKAVTFAGLELEVTMVAKNPNGIPLKARKVKARVKIDSNIDLGEVTVDSKVEIPAKGSKEIVAPLSLKWTDAASVASLALAKEKVPYTVEGTAEIGNDTINFDVPFKSEGTLTREELMKIGKEAVPQLPFPIPSGLSIPTALPF